VQASRGDPVGLDRPVPDPPLNYDGQGELVVTPTGARLHAATTAY
jgi:hypothetical protein